MNNFLSTLHYPAIFVSAAAYWAFGALWYSLIAGKSWSAEVQKHGIKLNEPSKADLITKLLLTFVFNLLIAFGIAVLVRFIDLNGAVPGFKLGLLTGITIIAAAIATIYTWESRSLKLFFLDALYPVIGTVICGIILSSWR